VEKELESEFSIGDNEKVGDYLRRVREARGVELEYLAKAIRLSKNILESIEANRWGDFPTEAYLRSYIISLCEKLLIDKHAVINRFSLEINSHFAVSQANMMSEQNQESPVSNNNASRVAIIVVVVLAAVLFLAKNMLDSSYVEDPASQAQDLKPAVPAPIDDELKLDEPVENDSVAAQAAQQPAIDLNAKDTLRLECSHSATDNTCGVSLKGVDNKMNYFSRTTSRYISYNDTSQITITVPLRTKLFVNGTKVDYGRYNTLYFYQGQIIDKSNRDLR